MLLGDALYAGRVRQIRIPLNQSRDVEEDATVHSIFSFRGRQSQREPLLACKPSWAILGCTSIYRPFFGVLRNGI